MIEVEPSPNLPGPSSQQWNNKVKIPIYTTNNVLYPTNLYQVGSSADLEYIIIQTSTASQPTRNTSQVNTSMFPSVPISDTSNGNRPNREEEIWYNVPPFAIVSETEGSITINGGTITPEEVLT